MSDENRLVFPDEVDELKNRALDSSTSAEGADTETPLEAAPIQNDRIVFPDEAKEIKKRALENQTKIAGKAGENVEIGPVVYPEEMKLTKGELLKTNKNEIEAEII